MSAVLRGTCSECGEDKRVTKAGGVYKHIGVVEGEFCEGSGRPVQHTGDVANETVKDEYTLDNLVETLDEFRDHKLPIRVRLRQRIMNKLHNLRGCCDDA